MTTAITALAQATAFSPAAQTARTTALRDIKNQLHAQLPHIPSAHLSEAIAAGLGHRTHASLRASDAPVHAHTFDLSACMRRLMELGHAPDAPFWWPLSADTMDPPPAYKDLQATLRTWRTLPIRTQMQHTEIGQQMIAQCLRTMSELWDLGEPRKNRPASVAHFWNIGVDYPTALPGWQGVILQRDWSCLRMDRSTQSFFRRPLPLRGGRCVEYTSAVLTFNSDPDLQSAALVAGSVGWRATQLPGWNWWPDKDTMPMLYRPTSSHSDILQRWEHSFRRWVIEEQVLLKRNCSAGRRAWIDAVVRCPHFPLEFSDAAALQALQLRNWKKELLLGTPYQMDFLVSLLHRWQHGGA